MICSRYHAGLVLEPHWLYLSSMGIFLSVSVFLLRLRKYIKLAPWICIVIFILLFYCRETRGYNYLWRDPAIYYKYWLEKSPNNIARFNLANIYLENGKYGEAELLYQEVLSYGFLRKGDICFSSSIETSMVYNNIGIIYYNQNKLAEALGMFNQAIETNRNNSKAYFNRANVFLRDNQIDKAVLDYQKSVEVDPYNLDAHYNLAILYAKLGNQDKAIEEYSKAVVLDKNCFKNYPSG
jgi:tetratricopeptide (TPR) repeat protein